MKKLLPILFMLFFTSCREKEADCYNCTTTFTITAKYGAEIQTVTISDTREVCDQTDEMIREYERINTDSTTYINGDVRLDTVIVTLCTR
jgi:hypothetical protein